MQRVLMNLFVDLCFSEKVNFLNHLEYCVYTCLYLCVSVCVHVCLMNLLLKSHHDKKQRTKQPSHEK